MIVEAKNENSVLDGSVAITTPSIKNVYITTGTKTVVQPNKEGDSEKTKIELGKKCNKGLFGRTYFLVIETENFLEDSKAKFKVSLCSKIKGLSDVDTPFKVLVNSSDIDILEFSFNNYFEDEQISNKTDFKNKAIMEFSFDREDEEDKKSDKALISELEEKRASCYIRINEVIDAGSDIAYHGDKESDEKKCFYFEKTFTLLEDCLCNRDITEEELKYLNVTLYNKLIEIENRKRKTKMKPVSSKGVLNLRCPIKSEDKNHKRLAEELNQMFSRYNINSCNRKIHFIAQSFLESQSFSSTTEGADGENYELKNWENKKDNLETEINSIDRLLPAVNAILEKHKKKALDPKTNQVEQLDTQMKNLTLIEADTKTINEYKAIFEKEWMDNFDAGKNVKYETKEKYLEAKKVAISTAANRKAQGNTEEGDGPRYKGKGLIQLTWRNTYVDYFTYLTNLENPSDLIKKHSLSYFLDRKNKQEQLLNSELYFSVDSAGWFWNVYKPGLADYADYDGDTIVDYSVYRKSKWTTIKVKAIEAVTRKVNGGTTHLEERTAYYELLRDSIFEIRTTCENYDKIK